MEKKNYESPVSRVVVLNSHPLLAVMSQGVDDAPAGSRGGDYYFD